VPLADVAPQACAFTNLKLPEDFRILATGAYTGRRLGFQIDQSGQNATQFDVAVNSPDKPVVLILGAYDPAIWNIGWTPKTRIVAVLVSGYHRQAIAGLDPKVPTLNSTYDNKGACGHFYLSAQGAPEQLNPLARKLFGKPVDLVYPAARYMTSTRSTARARYVVPGAEDKSRGAYLDAMRPSSGDELIYVG
jgi:hypothetical protein